MSHNKSVEIDFLTFCCQVFQLTSNFHGIVNKINRDIKCYKKPIYHNKKQNVYNNFRLFKYFNKSQLSRLLLTNFQVGLTPLFS